MNTYLKAYRNTDFDIRVGAQMISTREDLKRPIAVEVGLFKDGEEIDGGVEWSYFETEQLAEDYIREFNEINVI